MFLSLNLKKLTDVANTIGAGRAAAMQGFSEAEALAIVEAADPNCVPYLKQRFVQAYRWHLAKHTCKVKPAKSYRRVNLPGQQYEPQTLKSSKRAFSRPTLKGKTNHGT